MKFVAKVAQILSVAVVAFSISCGDDSGENKPADLSLFVTEDLTVVKKCVSSCTTNAQCQNSCPDVSSGISCCDTATNACFTASTSSCPAPPPDLSMSMSY